jgi:hypothetical protein
MNQDIRQGLIAAGLLVITIIFAAKYYPNPANSINPPQPAPPSVTEINTNSWQTYRNEEYGFEIKYPLGFSVELTQQGGLFISNKEAGTTTSIQIVIETGPFYTKTYYNQNAKTIVGYEKDYISEGDMRIQILKNNIVNINNTNVRRQIYSAEDIKIGFDSIASVEKAIRYVIWDGKNKFIILHEVTQNPTDFDIPNDISNNIIATFHFL